MSKINVNTWEPESGTAATLMASGDTVTVPSGAALTIASGATITNSGTATGFGSSAVLRVHLLADEALTKNVSEQCKFDIEDFDTQGWYDNTTNFRFTPTVAGYYYVFTKINFAGTTQANSCFVSILKNTTVTAESYKTLPSGAEHSFTMADTVYLNGSSDYVEVWGESGANGSPIFDAVPAYSDGDGCFMTIFKVD